MNKPKWLKAVVISAAAASLIFPLSACAPKSESATAAESDTVTVSRGDITINISAAGNLAYSQQEDLTFDLAGTVEEVPVKVGDSVTSGEVLATLDNSAFEDSLSALQDQVTAKERALLQSQISLKNAETALDKAKNPYTEDEIKQAKQDLALAEEQLRYDYQHGSPNVLKDQQDVYTKQQTYDDMTAGGDEDDIALKQMQSDLAQGQEADAEKALANAQKDLLDAQNDSPQLIAPFDGFITQVNISGGDEITKGTVAMQIADPTKFEATLLVSEMDIFKLKLGGDAQVTVDALSGMSLPAKVTAISPTAAIQSGVVNYEVTVEVTPLATIRQQQQEAAQARQNELENLAPGQLPEQLQQAVDAGQLTQEQAQNIVTRMQQGGGFQVGGQSQAQTGQGTTPLSEDFELKQGLSVTVSIIIQQATDVLLVPNRAISYQAGKAHVQVVASDGTTEDRTIETGISDYQNTEVKSGLTEGEQVIVPKATATTTTSTQGNFPRPTGGFIMGGGPPP
jgi:multidrug efflux pump subunit AcrA (membrane-fusion protein)